LAKKGEKYPIHWEAIPMAIQNIFFGKTARDNEAVRGNGFVHAGLRHKLEALLSDAGVEIDGKHPWDPQIHDERLFLRFFVEGTLGLGESFMNGWWDCHSLDEFFNRVLLVGVDDRVTSVAQIGGTLRASLFNLQKPARAFQVGQCHYDIGNELYRHMLDKRMIYSCAYWENADTLDEAQEAKLDLICRKLDLKPGMWVLDIGCGWGGMAKFAAERYGVRVTGITVSKEQARLGMELCRGLPVKILLQDYRCLKGTFDRILSVGMMEHVGYKNYKRFFRVVRNCLKDDGLFLLHTIGRNRTSASIDPWVSRYIFPNYFLPSAKQLSEAIEGLFILEDWHNFGADYDKTLMHWFRNFNDNWNRLRERYDEKFYRMWKYYLLSCAACFRARAQHVWQIVLSPRGVPGGYAAPR
jgi:cyclopropane-fatty-acyl-phospholipid synthase